MRGAAEHRELAAALRRVEAAVVLSGYPSDLYDQDLYAGWHRVTRAARTDNAATRRERVEVLWSNRSFPTQPTSAELTFETSA